MWFTEIQRLQFHVNCFLLKFYFNYLQSKGLNFTYFTIIQIPAITTCQLKISLTGKEQGVSAVLQTGEARVPRETHLSDQKTTNQLACQNQSWSVLVRGQGIYHWASQIIKWTIKENNRVHMLQGLRVKVWDARWSELMPSESTWSNVHAYQLQTLYLV